MGHLRKCLYVWYLFLYYIKSLQNMFNSAKQRVKWSLRPPGYHLPKGRKDK